ncbi:MAG: hypothetical protein JXB07_07170 [Anaerolineae bacterium]|nr:hypothetical protein [Anaerolineae bacterium]
MSTSKERALETIQKRQFKWAQVWSGQSTIADSELCALALAEKRETNSHIDGGYIYTPSLFKYPEKSERLRWQHTREIIERSKPGMYENPEYLEIIARQTASIEMILREELGGHPNERTAKLTERVLLATVPEPFVNAQSESEEIAAHTDYVLVFLSYGLIQFLYQATKAVVLSWKPKTPPPGMVSCFSSRQEDTEAVLAKDPYPIDLLLGTLRAFFFEGFPRDPASKPPEGGYLLPISMLITLSERFVIAHEYGHALLHHGLGEDIDLHFPPEVKAWDKEFQADAFAFFMVLASANQLDLLPNHMALQGPLFALHAIDVLREAIDVMRSGKIMADQGFDTHPPTKSRIESLKSSYRRFYCQNEDDYQYIKGALLPSETLLLLWKYVLPRLAALRGSAKLHPIWGTETA